MMKIRKMIAVILLFSSVQTLCACGHIHTDIPEKIHIGVACDNQSDTFLAELLESLRTQAEMISEDDCSIILTMRDAAGSQRTQNDQVEELIDAGCNVLCVNLVERADPSDIIDLARDRNIPIIFFNREPVTEDLMQWDGLYYVGADARQSGVMQGELAAECIKANDQIDKNKDGKIQYVVLEGEPGHQDSIIRTESAVETIKSKGIELEKLSYGIANWNRAQAQNRMIQMLGQYHHKIELVLANNDDMALGAIDAYENMNFTESAFPVFFGIDGTVVGLEAIKAQKLDGTVYNDKEGQAKAMLELARTLICGGDFENLDLINGKYIYLPYIKVDLSNVNGFIDADEK